MQKLDKMKMRIQLKVQKHWNTFKVALTADLHGVSIQMLQNETGRNLEASYIAHCKPDFNKQKDFEN